MYLLLAHLHTRPDTTDAVCCHLDSLTAAAASEPGTLVYAFYRTCDDPCQIVVHEVYRDKAACDAHLESAAVQQVLAAFSDLLAEPPVVVVGQMVKGYGMPEGV